jgi:hypothetical protein
MMHRQHAMHVCLRVVSVGGAESIIFSAGSTESMMLSACADTESIILSAPPAENMILSALFGCVIMLTVAATKKTISNTDDC